MPGTTTADAFALAAHDGHKDMAELLLANKAEVNAKDNNGLTPLHGRRLMATRTWRNCCWPTRPMSMPRTTTARRLCTWRRIGHKDMAELLLANKADVNAKDNTADAFALGGG